MKAQRLRQGRCVNPRLHCQALTVSPFCCSPGMGRSPPWLKASPRGSSKALLGSSRAHGPVPPPALGGGAAGPEMGAETSATGNPYLPAPRAQVTLHVYDLGNQLELQALNDVIGKLGTGAFHCGVEVFGHEFSFDWRSQGSGIFMCPPKKSEGHHYRTSIDMGPTDLTAAQIDDLCRTLRRQWPGRSYNLLNRNCCSFCDEFCIGLGVGRIPPWTRNLAGAASSLKDAYGNVAAAAPQTFSEALVALGDSIMSCGSMREKPAAARNTANMCTLRMM
mmetsp:Transcript_56370/g.183114  ORF Transcript_56370/g.183114 Transcript_56370/m.183114 type:complete len:277 (-) Transcript_56370:486-1316(-)